MIGSLVVEVLIRVQVKSYSHVRLNLNLDNVIVIRTLSEKVLLSKYLKFYLMSAYLEHYWEQYGHGTLQQHITIKDVKTLPILRYCTVFRPNNKTKILDSDILIQRVSGNAENLGKIINMNKCYLCNNEKPPHKELCKKL